MNNITEAITQILGVAYSYQPSLALRRRKTVTLTAHHSSQYRDFSFFVKSCPETVATDGENLVMRYDPVQGTLAKHWPEPELVILLGKGHKIKGYTLGNDFTAHSVELRGRTAEFDGTFFGKCWPGSCALGPRWFTPEEVGDDGNLEIGLKIIRDGETVYNQKYNTNGRRYPFSEIPAMVVRYASEFGSDPPPSKRVRIGSDNLLLEGTVILLGTGIIVKEQFHSRLGDRLIVYSPQLGELTNTVAESGQ